jgi:flagellar assembly protein FliH
MAGESPRVLKANAVRELGGRVAFNFEDLRQKGEEYMTGVRAEADALLAAARKEVESLREQARKEGRDAGRAEGLQAAQLTVEQQVAQRAEQVAALRFKTALPALEKAAAALQSERDDWLVRWESTAVELSVAVAGKLVRGVIEVETARVRTMLRDVLQLAAGQSQVVIHLAPADVEQLGVDAAELVRSTSGCADARLIADPELGQGDCRIVTQHGEIDARIETMLDRITAELLGQPPAA